MANVELEKGTINIKQVIVKGENGRPLIKGTKSKNLNVLYIYRLPIEELKKFHTH